MKKIISYNGFITSYIMKTIFKFTTTIINDCSVYSQSNTKTLHNNVKTPDTNMLYQ